MFSTMVLHSGSDRAHRLRYLVAAADCLDVVRDLDGSPGDRELQRLVGNLAPEVIIVDITNLDALPFASLIREVAPATAIIGYGAQLEAALTAPRLGFDSALGEDASEVDLRNAIYDAMRKHQGGIDTGLFCFLPSKAGTGCSTIVMNTAVALARDEGKRVLVVDADLRSGIQSVLIGVEPNRSLQSLLAGINQFDKKRLPDCVNSFLGVDFLLSTPSLDAGPPEWADYFHLLSMARSTYDAVLVDLPELVNPATVELVRRARQIYVVTTPEVPSMTLAKHRCQELTRLSLPKTRIGLLVNRWHRTDPDTELIGRLIDHPVSRIFPNDYPGVRNAIVNKRPVSPRSNLGLAFTEFAGELFGKFTLHDNSFTGKLKSLWGGIRETVNT